MKRKNWTIEETEFLKENYGEIPLEEIAQKLDRTIPSIKHKAERNGIKSKLKIERAWTDKQVQYLKENYKTHTNIELAKILNKTKVAIDLKANILGLKNTQYHYDQLFFSKIDTEEKAYWCGFIMADGCVTINQKNNSCELCIRLAKRDYHHLEKFNQSLHGNIPVTFRTDICNLSQKKYTTSNIRIYSQQLVHDLEKYNVIPCKSLVKEFPTNIPEELMSHYVRGYFDGNGCISYVGKRLQCSFTMGSHKFANGLFEYLQNQKIKCYKYKYANIHSLRIGSSLSNILDFLNHIYSNSSIYLDRKYEKYQKIVQNKKSQIA